MPGEGCLPGFAYQILFPATEVGCRLWSMVRMDIITVHRVTIGNPALSWAWGSESDVGRSFKDKDWRYY